MTTNQKHQTLNFSGFLIAFAGAVLFSTKAIFVKKAFEQIQVDPLTLLTIRMLFALPFYVVTAWVVRRQEPGVRMSGRQWLAILWLGIMGYYLSSLFDFIGLKYISAGLERLILFLYPTFALLINRYVYKQPLHRNQQLALLLTYAGIGLAYIGELQIDTSNPNFFLGSFLIFLCSITYSFYIVGSGRIIPQVGATKFTAYAMMAATAGIFVHFALSRPWSDLQSGATLWWYGIALAVIATVIPSFLLSLALKRIGSNNTAIVSSIGPVSTIVQAHYFLGEQIFPGQLVGTVLVVAGILMLSWKKKGGS
ncbi:DMT family transporter [Paraflavisolibacter sp. H34]|uniref:DMT family transporter n=1 Tax=Huijunlia imazamoxiresistens TaxID=3127457 RepID=UPI003015FC64